MQKFQLCIAALFIIIAQFFISNNSLASFGSIDENACLTEKQTSDLVLEAVKEKDHDAIRSLSNCIKYNHKLIFQASLIDPSQLANADDIFRSDENFIYRLIKVNPEILQYVAPELKQDQHFIEEASYLSRSALQYADPKLLDSRAFMEKMVRIDSKNYIYASNRVKEIPEIAAIAFEDDGLLLMHAPPSIKNNRKLVKIALQSNVSALEYASEDFKKDVEMLLLVGPKPVAFNEDAAAKFLRKHYIDEEKHRNIGLILDKKTKFFAKRRLVNRSYITKWQRLREFNGTNIRENLHLITAESRNNPRRFADDLKKYPGLVDKIEKFFMRRHLDRNTIDDLSLTYLWKIKDKPLTLAFNLYLLRDSNDSELGPDYVSVTSLTAIVEKVDKEWRLTVVEVVLDSEIKADVAYENGKKEYVLQDLYVTDKNDKNPKLLFRVEDRFTEYFEIFSEQKGGKYKMVYRFDPLAASN